MTKWTFEKSIGKRLRICCALVEVLSLFAIAGTNVKGAEGDLDIRVTAEAWPEADAMFHRDPALVGWRRRLFDRPGRRPRCVVLRR